MKINHLLRDTVTYAPRTGTDKHGDPKFGSQTEISARVELGTRVRNSEGDIIGREDKLITDADVSDDDMFWLPDADTSNNREARRAKDLRKGDALSTGDPLVEVILE